MVMKTNPHTVRANTGNSVKNESIAYLNGLLSIYVEIASLDGSPVTENIIANTISAAAIPNKMTMQSNARLCSLLLLKCLKDCLMVSSVPSSSRESSGTTYMVDITSITRPTINAATSNRTSRPLNAERKMPLITDKIMNATMNPTKTRNSSKLTRKNLIPFLLAFLKPAARSVLPLLTSWPISPNVQPYIK